MMHKLFQLRFGTTGLLLVLALALLMWTGTGVAVADIPPGPPPSRTASTGTEVINPSMMLYAWLGCSMLSFVVTWLLANSGKTAALQTSTAPGSESNAAGTASTRAAQKRRPRQGMPTWRMMVLPFVWLPLPCMFAVFSLGATQPLVLELQKSKMQEIVGYDQKRNDPGWLASSNDMREPTSYASVYISYAALGLMALNCCLLLLLSVQAFAGRDPEDDEVIAANAGSSSGVAPAVATEPAGTTSSDQTSPSPSATSTSTRL
jgi:H+/gluconate symporter-like permease